MIRLWGKKRTRYVIIDVDTQRDLFLATGHACIRNHRRILERVRRVMAWARNHNVPVISTCVVQPANGNGNGNERYCVDGTEGQKKIRYTVLSRRISYAADGNTDLPLDLLSHYRQVILNKRCVDPFDEPRIERLLSELRAEEFIVMGAIAEGAVEATVLGLLQRGKKVTVVMDAVGVRDYREAQLALRKIEAKGAKLVEAKRIAGVSHLRNVGACTCSSCRRNGKSAQVKAVGEDDRNGSWMNMPRGFRARN